MTADPPVKPHDIIGNFGKYQVLLVILNLVACTHLGYAVVFVELLAPSMDLYWDWDATNPNKTIFKSTKCKMADIYEYNKNANMSNSSSMLIYESKYSRRTLTEELNLVCERSWLVSFSSTMLLIGFHFGYLAFTRISEKYGRTRTTMWMGFLALISNVLVMFSQGCVMFVLAITLYGATSAPLGAFLFFQVLELASTSWIEYAGTFMKTGSLLGQIMLVGVAWLLKDGFYTQLFHIVFTGIFIILSFYILESPAWLAVRGKYEEAKNTIIRIVVRNGLDPNEAQPTIEKYIEQMKRRCEIESTAEKGKITDLFKNRVITFNTIVLIIIRSFLYFLYFSLVMNAESFGSGLYVDMTASNCMALGSFFISVALLRKFSLRIQIIFLSFCAGAICIAYIFLYKILWARSVLIIVGRSFMTPATNMFEVFASTMDPTSVRGVSSGFRAAVSGLIISLTPFTKELSNKTASYVPFILFAVCGFTSAVLLKILPETKGRELVHTVDELVKRKTEEQNVLDRKNDPLKYSE